MCILPFRNYRTIGLQSQCMEDAEACQEIFDRSVCYYEMLGRLSVGRKATVPDEQLIASLSRVFRDVGYEGATLSVLEAATGLKKASLYHRFPGGKAQMATEVLEAAGTWLDQNILTPLRSDASPELRIESMVKRLDEFYSGGKQACLLNMLSSSRVHDDGPFATRIREMFNALIEAFAAVALDGGADKKTSKVRAERVVILLHGSLVLARGIGSTRPFQDFLKSLPNELLESKGAAK